MKEWKISKDDLISRLNTLEMVPGRPGVASSVYICMKSKGDHLRLMLSSEILGYVDLKGDGKWPFDKEIFIDRRLLVPFVKASENIKSKSPFTFSTDGKSLIISNGYRKAKFHVASVYSGYSTATSSGHEVKTEKDTNSLLVAARYCADNDVATPELGCVYVKQNDKKTLTVYASSGKIIFRAGVKSALKIRRPIPFPLFIIDLLAVDGLEGIEVNEKEIVLDFKHGKIWQSVSAKAAKKFPWKSIDKWCKKEAKESKLALIFNSKDFGNVVARIASYLTSVRRIDWTLKVEGKKGDKVITLLTEIPSGVFKEKVKLEHSIKQDISVEWPLDKLLDVFLAIASRKHDISVHFDSDGRAYLRSGSIELLIPRRTDSHAKNGK